MLIKKKVGTSFNCHLLDYKYGVASFLLTQISNVFLGFIVLHFS